ncbi:hypothetical protein M0R04_09240 [Candidatus Dojkabacteria bacterium]|jgi:hypothetical protein|nr:hypothetical protein [Candidatus Dojkabacteria bacterium]
MNRYTGIYKQAIGSLGIMFDYTDYIDFLTVRLEKIEAELSALKARKSRGFIIVQSDYKPSIEQIQKIYDTEMSFGKWKEGDLVICELIEVEATEKEVERII